MNEGKRRQRERGRNEKGSERGEETGGKDGGGGGGGGEGTRSEVSRDDAVVRLQGRRKEEPRREPVPVTGPPAGRRTRHTAPYRPLLSHSLPSPLYALRPPHHRCVTSLRTSRRLLATGAILHALARSRVAFKFFKQCQLVPRVPGVRADNAVAPVVAFAPPSPVSTSRVLSPVPFPPPAYVVISSARCLARSSLLAFMLSMTIWILARCTLPRHQRHAESSVLCEAAIDAIYISNTRVMDKTADVGSLP